MIVQLKLLPFFYCRNIDILIVYYYSQNSLGKGNLLLIPIFFLKKYLYNNSRINFNSTNNKNCFSTMIFSLPYMHSSKFYCV